MYTIHYTENKKPCTAYSNNLSPAVQRAKDEARKNRCYACVTDANDKIIISFHGKHM